MIVAYAESQTAQNAVSFLQNAFSEAETDTEVIDAAHTVSGCIGCGKCWKKQRCVFEDEVNRAVDRMNEADAFLLISDVRYGQPPKSVMDFMERLTHSVSHRMADKPAAFLPCGKKNALEAYALIHPFFTGANMIILSSKEILGTDANENEAVLGSLSKRMIWLLECIRTAEKNGRKAPENTYQRKQDYIR